MTKEDEDAAVGRMVARLSELKRRRAALAGEAGEMSRLLDAAAQSLRGVDYVKAFWDGRNRGTSMNRSDVGSVVYPPAERANALFDELREVSRELRETRDRLQGGGVDLD
jgi:hypothetical protein